MIFMLPARKEFTSQTLKHISMVKILQQKLENICLLWFQKMKQYAKKFSSFIGRLLRPLGSTGTAMLDRNIHGIRLIGMFSNDPNFF